MRRRFAADSYTEMENITTGQVTELIALFAKKLPLSMPKGTAQKWIENPDDFAAIISEALLPKESAFRTGMDLYNNIEKQFKGWQNFYTKFFGLTPDLSGVIIPAHVEGFDRLVIVAQGISLNQVWEVCREQFDCWKYISFGLESVMQESECGPAQATTARWFRDRVEADEEMKSLSARQLTEQNIAGITLMEYLLLELKYFSETGKHLDIKNWTLCSGSRYSDGTVPYVGWRGGRLRVDWYGLGTRDDSLRSRVAVE